MTTQTIAVIDYGMGNLRSVSKALEHVNPDAKILISNDTATIKAADKIVFPGVGAIYHCMEELQARDLIETVKEVSSSKPFLGICLGMQLLFSHSEENHGTEALNIIAGEVPKFPHTVRAQGLCVPHMGWNSVQQTTSHPLWKNINDDSPFYFVHSFYVQPANAQVVAGSCQHGIDFCAAVAHENIFACQFHPEKSQQDGLQLLHNFTLWNGQS